MSTKKPITLRRLLAIAAAPGGLRPRGRRMVRACKRAADLGLLATGRGPTYVPTFVQALTHATSHAGERIGLDSDLTWRHVRIPRARHGHRVAATLREVMRERRRFAPAGR